MTSHPSPNEFFLVEAPKAAPKAASIVCGTDFSEAGTQAVEVATALAKRLHESLVLVHAASDHAQGNLPRELRESLCLYARAQLHAEEERLRTAQVETIKAFRAGAPDAILLEEAAAHHARLLVLGSSKRRSPSRSLRAGVAERVAEAAPAPTLVVREAAPLLRWACGERRMRVLVGADFSAPSEAALRWVNWLEKTGPCDVIVVYLEPSAPAYSTTDLYPSPLVDELILKETRMQERHFRQRVQSILGPPRVRVRFETGWGLSDAHLIELAAQERADLIVIGTHSRRGWQRLGHHSVSRGVLRYAPLNVACVPAEVLEDPGLFFREYPQPLNPPKP